MCRLVKNYNTYLDIKFKPVNFFSETLLIPPH